MIPDFATDTLMTMIRKVIGRYYYRAIATARRYASAVYAIRPSVCMSVCLSVRLSHVGVLWKDLNIIYHRANNAKRQPGDST